jgi:hypothetical protein
VNARAPAFAVLNASRLEQGMDSAADPSAGIGTNRSGVHSA